MSYKSEKELREKIGVKDEVVYHYCSLETLFHILSSRSLWLTPLDSSNDKQELQIAEKILNEALTQMIDSESKPDLNNMYEQILMAPQDHKFKPYRPKHKYYGLSLVRDKDSLIHWKMYSSNMTGVCIGINVTLIKYMLLIRSIPEVFRMWLQSTEIFYNRDDQLEYAKASVNARIKGFTDIQKGLAKTKGVFSAVYYNTLSSLKPRFKHEGFSNENEYRVYLEEGEPETTASFVKNTLALHSENDRKDFEELSDTINDLAKNFEIRKEDKKYGMIGGIIRSYYSLKFGDFWHDALIQEIVLGPKCYQNHQELKKFLKECNLDRTKVSRSKIPLR